MLSEDEMLAGSDNPLRRRNPLEPRNGLLKQTNHQLPDFWWRIWVREADG